MRLPNIVSEEDEPRNIKKNSAEEENRIGTPKALTATLNCHQSEQCYGQIYEQNPVVQCSQRSKQSATYLFYLLPIITSPKKEKRKKKKETRKRKRKPECR
jgi:hypothetical protein